MIQFLKSARFASAGALMLLLASCASQKPTVKLDDQGKPINPYPAGTYEHFKAEPTYPKTHSVWKNEELLSRTDASNQKKQALVTSQQATKTKLAAAKKK